MWLGVISARWVLGGKTLREIRMAFRKKRSYRRVIRSARQGCATSSDAGRLLDVLPIMR